MALSTGTGAFNNEYLKAKEALLRLSKTLEISLYIAIEYSFSLLN